ncbi:hypothetical protein [Nocardia seriolae]|uniref:Uncharacterized protein n=1 Tax=Nocardia seriolae TaxID=37332 RepID=A0ABC8AQD8_9NOCA|nr:hypothetical protein [Nocardia seriolae]APA96313.1 hypothetical protein NS506_02247 [Nocardia seriolae]OJF84778.1 hypothetical protein NS14008_28600 [Nocardia seriolae]QOW33130.1 hypothetical protein IMZ23_35695 [Nocardia seriolae]WNJ60673.1 hypothetical protein RMO66_08065 [Nocardia seriolae]
MASWLEELERRETAARERAEELHRRIVELSHQLAVVEEQLSRLAITRETMIEILGGPVESVESTLATVAEDVEGPQPVSGGSPIGVLLIPPRTDEIDVSVLPQDYRDILEVLADSGRGLRTAHVAAALGLDEARSTVESLRSQLKRLTARGWLDEAMPGMFTLADGINING